ncbi:hypothetical protein FRC02_003081 [Tulasnella sp. 418]|nr:hypothetical protein FRC02_003081 [Tulasnella sp. 418]
MSSSANVSPPSHQKVVPSPSVADEDQVVWRTPNGPASKRSTPGTANTPISSIKDTDASSPWKMTNGQITDPTSGSKWDIADEILKLQISADGRQAPNKSDGSPKAFVDEPEDQIQGSATSPSKIAASNSHPSSPGHVLASSTDDASAPHSRQLSATDDTSSSGRSSSLATPSLSKDDTAVLKPALNGNVLANGKKDNYSPPASAGSYPNGAYHVNGNGQVTSVGSPTAPGVGVQSPQQFPHPIQTGVLPGHPQFSPHHIPPPPRGLTSDMHHLAQAAHHHMHTQQFDPYRTGAPTDNATTGLDYSARDGLASSGMNTRPGMPGLNGAAPNGTTAPAYTLGTQDLGASGGAPSFDPRTYPTSPPPQAYASHPLSPTLSPTYDPTVLRDAAAGLGAALGGLGDQTNPSASHAHSMSLSHTYSPQMPTSPYSPLSPNPYQSFYAHLPPPPPPPSSQAHQEVLNAMARMSPTTYAANPNAAYAAAAAAAAIAAADPATLALMQGGAGPSANNRKLGLYKTELCRSWEEKGSCRYGSKCQFAHGEDEIRKVARHPKYKTEICRTFWVSGSCPYGKRCCFIHTELPASGTPGAPGPATGDGQRPGSTGANGTTPGGANGNNNTGVDGRARSMSTNSDPNDAPSSLLARISAKANANNAARLNDTSSPANGAGTGSGPYGSSPTEVSAAVTAAAIAQAYAQYGRPAQAALGAIEKENNVSATVPSANTSSKNASGTGTPVNAGVSTPVTTTSSGLGHRVSASMDFSGHTRHQTLGGELSGLDLGGHGHQRNPSASSIVHSTYSIAHLNPRSSETRLSGHSTPFGGTGESSITSSRVSPAPGGHRFGHERSHSIGNSRNPITNSYKLDNW